MDLKELLGKKKTLEPDMKDAKLKAIKEMRKVASDAMSDDLKGSMSKATVIAKDKEGLAEGLEKAKEIAESPELETEAPEELDLESEDAESEYEEDHGEELLEECDTPEKIDEMIAKLAEKKRALEA